MGINILDAVKIVCFQIPETIKVAAAYLSQTLLKGKPDPVFKSSSGGALVQRNHQFIEREFISTSSHTYS